MIRWRRTRSWSRAVTIDKRAPAASLACLCAFGSLGAAIFALEVPDHAPYLRGEYFIGRMLISIALLPKMESVAFAWSASQETGPGVGVWHPHMMVYAPYYENSTLGGNDIAGHAPFVAGGGGTPFSIVVIALDDELAIKPREK
jgi:hypothetical protein